MSLIESVSTRLGHRLALFLLGFLLLAVLLLVVAGCVNREMLGPNPRLPTPPPFSDSGQSLAPDRWWTAFDDPELDYWINQSFDSSYTLAAALQRVCAARAFARREASDLWPDLNGIAGVGSGFGPGENQTIIDWGFDASYQVDLWGQIESRVDAERLRADATCEDYHAIALTLSGEIARTWFSLIEAHAQVELLDEQIETNRVGLQLQESRFGLGLIRSADVLRQRQLLESTLEQAVVAEARIEVLAHQMAVLLGQMPQTASFETGTVLPDLPLLPETGLPSELVNRRPDVRRNYLAFQAADRDLAAAVSAQYPRLNLTGLLLNSAESPENLFRDWFASIGGQLIAPLFDGGERRAEVDRTSALVCVLFNEYAQSILTAFREVEDSLAQEKYQLERIKHLEQQVILAGQASEQLREQYLIGDVEYLDVLSSITGEQSLQRERLSAQLELVLIRVTLYLALAGDFEPCAVDLAAPSQVEFEDLPDSESEEAIPPETESNE